MPRASESATRDIKSTTGACGDLAFESDVMNVDFAMGVNVPSHDDLEEDFCGGVMGVQV